jgi:precorrin-8X/cobalt-precorrin-8 methylmutase
MNYLHDGAAIYAQSFATIRAEADLSAFTPDEARIVVRIIHACGMVEIADAVHISPHFYAAFVIQKWSRMVLPARAYRPAMR